MRWSARADLDKTWEQSVLGSVDPGIVNQGYCLAKRRMPLLKETQNKAGQDTHWVPSFHSVKSVSLEQLSPVPTGGYTPQLPPYPISTLSPFTITGTFLTPPEYLSISSNFAESVLTSKYCAVSP